jgi:hypothetical protein
MTARGVPEGKFTRRDITEGLPTLPKSPPRQRRAAKFRRRAHGRLTHLSRNGHDKLRLVGIPFRGERPQGCDELAVETCRRNLAARRWRGGDLGSVGKLSVMSRPVNLLPRMPLMPRRFVKP